MVSSVGRVPPDEARSVRSAGAGGTPGSGLDLVDLVSRIDSGRLRIHVLDCRPLRHLSSVSDDSAVRTVPVKTVLVVA